jgi:hypothetical protein
MVGRGEVVLSVVRSVKVRVMVLLPVVVVMEVIVRVGCVRVRVVETVDRGRVVVR